MHIYKKSKKILTTFSEYLNEKSNLNNKKLRLITEKLVEGKTIINVDIQPEYSKFISFNVNNWVSFINKNAHNNL